MSKAQKEIDAAPADAQPVVLPPGARPMMTVDQVLALVPVSRSTLDRMVEQGRFPEPVDLSDNRIAWFADEVIAWQNALSRKGGRARPPRRDRQA